MLKKFLPNWLFRRGMVEAREPWCLSQPLFKLSKKDDFRIRNAVEGIAIFGGTGGGKSSGSGHTINQAFLRAGMGGLVLCAKSDEARMWQEYAREAGRSSGATAIDKKGTNHFRKEMFVGQKIGEEFFRSQIDLGRREIGGLWYDGSNIAQPSYPLRGHYGPLKEIESPGLGEPTPSYEELHPVGPSRDDPGREDRDLERE